MTSFLLLHLTGKYYHGLCTFCRHICAIILLLVRGKWNLLTFFENDIQNNTFKFSPSWRIQTSGFHYSEATRICKQTKNEIVKTVISNLFQQLLKLTTSWNRIYLLVASDQKRITLCKNLSSTTICMGYFLRLRNSTMNCSTNFKSILPTLI